MSLQHNTQGFLLVSFHWYLGWITVISIRKWTHIYRFIPFIFIENLNNEVTWTYIWVVLQLRWITKLMKCDELGCIKFHSCYLQKFLSIVLFYSFTPGHNKKGPINWGLSVLPSRSFLGIDWLFFWELDKYCGVVVV